MNMKPNIIENLLKDFYIVMNSKTELKKEVIIDFSSVIWISGEFTPFLATLMRELQHNGFKVKVIPSNNKRVSEFLDKNGFNYCLLNHDITVDTYDTTIQFVELVPQSIDEVNNYIDKKLFQKIKNEVRYDIPKNSSFYASIFELCDNVKVHSGSDVIRLCGQFYPAQSTICFSICDNGITIPKLITNKNKCLSDWSDSDLIDWSTKEGNTTKDEFSAGMGLFDTFKSSLASNGSMKILSNFGFWKVKKNGNITKRNLKYPFHGTCVTFSMNTEENDDIIMENEAVEF